MDFSQLPKMSKSPPPAVNDVPAPVPQPPPFAQQQYAPIAYGSTPANALVSIWVSLVVGLICLMLGWNFARFLGARMTGRTFETGINWISGDKAGLPVGYFELQGGTAWTETGFFVMGVALLLDAVLIFAASRQTIPNRSLVLAAITVAAMALLLNLGVALYQLKLGIMPLASMILVLVGGFVLFDQTPMLRSGRHAASS